MSLSSVTYKDENGDIYLENFQSSIYESIFCNWLDEAVSWIANAFQSSIYESIFCNADEVVPCPPKLAFQSSIYESIFCNK